MKILVTGANGFIGSRLVAALRVRSDEVVAATRIASEPDQFGIGALEPDTDWRGALDRCDAVVHTAARVHHSDATSLQALAEYRRVNAAATLNLARQAAANGVRRFVFISSIKAMGEQGAFRPDDACTPGDAYGITKREAETGLLALTAASPMELVILRPPLVYGPGVGANFLQLMKAVDAALPLPLGAIDNRRSLLYVDNLIDAIDCCLRHPNAVRKIYLPRDAEDVATPDLVRQLAAGLGKRARLVPVPLPALRLAAACLNRRAVVERLTGSLTLDNSAMQRDLGWQPPYSMQEGMRLTADWYRRRSR